MPQREPLQERFFRTFLLRLSPPDTDRRHRWHATGQPGAGRVRNQQVDRDERSAGQFLPACAFFVWLILAGRGFGKTLTGANAVLDLVEGGELRRFGISAPTAGDLRGVVVEGETGILACSDPQFRPHYEPSKKRITWDNGAIAHLFSADEPDRFRGPNLDGFWADELAAYKHLGEVWSNILLMCRKGRPRIICTTTPKPLKLLRELMAKESTVVTRGATLENVANLAQEFIDNVVAPLEGTRLGRQELLGEILEDVPGALWTWGMINDHRVDQTPAHRVKTPDGEEGEWWEEEVDRCVVGVDPSVTATSASDECGIVAAKAGRAPRGWAPKAEAPHAVLSRERVMLLPHYYVTDDWSGVMAAEAWACSAAALMSSAGGDRLAAEVNNGGDLVESTLRGANINLPILKVRASVGKMARAEPVAALYEQGRVHHVARWDERSKRRTHDHLRRLEDEMMSYTGQRGEASPNRLDALVWSLTELAGLAPGAGRHWSFGVAKPRQAQAQAQEQVRSGA